MFANSERRKTAALTKTSRHFQVAILLLLSVLPSLLMVQFRTSSPTMTVYTDPIGLFTGTGTTPVYQSNPQKIVNSNFDTGSLQPWTLSVFNANSSTAKIIWPGYNTNNASQLSVTSGNLTSNSYVRLTRDLSTAQAGFSNNVTFQATVDVTVLSGNSSMDRAGIILFLATSTGSTVRLHYVFNSGGVLPGNTTSDAYFKVASYALSSWISITRNIANDALAAFPTLYPSIDAVKDVTLYVDSMSYGNPNRDPRIKFYNGDLDANLWNNTETVVYDSDNDGTYQPGDPLLYNGTFTPITGQALATDPHIKYVDAANAGKWTPGDPIVYDCNNGIPGDCNNNVVDINEPVIAGNPIIGQLLMDPIRRTTTASFDQLRLYAPTTTGNMLVNGGFETGSLQGWGNTAGFSISTTSHTGSYSALGSTNGGTVQLAQSIDSQPKITSLTLLQAAVDTITLNGQTSNDLSSVSLGLSDSKGTPLSINYVFETGNGALPSNSTGAIYYGVSGFGTSNQWVSIDRTLLTDTTPFNTQGFTSPYSLSLITLQLKSSTTATTTAYFDDIIINPGLPQTASPASSTFYALDGQNTTYAYSASNIPAGAFSLQIPSGQEVLNITSPGSTTLPQTDYNTTNTPSYTLINIPNSTVARYIIGGTYHFYTTSFNAVSSIYAQDATSLALLNLTNTITPGRKVDLVELSIDPYTSPLSEANSTITIWSSDGTQTSRWTGTSDNNGFFRVHDVALPLSNGTYTLQATSDSRANVGINTRLFSILVVPPTPFPLLLVILIAIVIVAAGAVLVFFLRKRRGSQKAISPAKSVKQAKKPPPRT